MGRPCNDSSKQMAKLASAVVDPLKTLAADGSLDDMDIGYRETPSPSPRVENRIMNPIEFEKVDLKDSTL